MPDAQKHSWNPRAEVHLVIRQGHCFISIQTPWFPLLWLNLESEISNSGSTRNLQGEYFYFLPVAKAMCSLRSFSSPWTAVQRQVPDDCATSVLQLCPKLHTVLSVTFSVVQRAKEIHTHEDKPTPSGASRSHRNSSQNPRQLQGTFLFVRFMPFQDTYIHLGLKVLPS